MIEVKHSETRELNPSTEVPINFSLADESISRGKTSFFHIKDNKNFPQDPLESKSPSLSNVPVYARNLSETTGIAVSTQSLSPHPPFCFYSTVETPFIYSVIFASFFNFLIFLILEGCSRAINGSDQQAFFFFLIRLHGPSSSQLLEAGPA